MKEPIQSGGEALPEISRRTFIATAGAGAAVVVVGTSAAAVAAEPEHPWDKARRLARELSEVLCEGDGGWSGPGSEWLAEIYPADKRGYAIGFGSIDAREWPRRNVSLPWQNLVAAHKEASEAFSRSVDECDVAKPSKAALRRWNRANRAEERALHAICAFRPHGAADAKAKATYIAPYIRRGELTPDQIMALNYSVVRP